MGEQRSLKSAVKGSIPLSLAMNEIDYVKLSEAVARIWEQSDRIAEELEAKFEARQKQFEEEKRAIVPSWSELQEPFTL